MFATEFVSNAIAYFLPGDHNRKARIFTNRTASIVNTEATALLATGAFSDGRVAVYADKYTGATLNNDLNDDSTVIIDEGTWSHLYGGLPNNGAYNFGAQNVILAKGTLPVILATGKANNVGVANSYNVISVAAGDTNFSLTGLKNASPTPDGTLVVIAYYGTSVLTVVNASADSSSGNKIYTATGADVVSTGRCNLIFIYDTALDSGAGGWNLIVAAL